MPNGVTGIEEIEFLDRGNNVKKRTHIQLLQTFLLVLTMMGFCHCADAASTVVWQIGKFDQSSLEFTLRSAPVPKPGLSGAQSDLVYVIGKSTAGTDWPAFQPGSSNGKAGYRRHPYAIQFELPSSPQGLYTLKVALLVESPRISRLEVEINGHRALYFQHPELDYTGGDVSSVFLPNYSADTITAELPTRFLRQGKNELVLTANDDPPERDDVTDSGLYYDALGARSGRGGEAFIRRTRGSGYAHDFLYAEGKRAG